MSRKHGSDPKHSSDSASDYGSDSEYGSDEDSGYSSGDINDEVEEPYEEMRARFAAEGPVMPSLSDGSRDALEAEKSRWNAWVFPGSKANYANNLATDTARP
jgi:hypothetical protein